MQSQFQCIYSGHGSYSRKYSKYLVLHMPNICTVLCGHKNGRKIQIHYRRIGLIEIPGMNFYVRLDQQIEIVTHCFGEKSFVTVDIQETGIELPCHILHFEHL